MNPLAHAAVRVSFSALGAFLGWMVGNALGYAVGVALDRATGNDWVSHALLTIRLGGLAGILLGGFLGLRLSRRVTTPRATAVAGVATVFAVVLMVLVIVPIAKWHGSRALQRVSATAHDQTILVKKSHRRCRIRAELFVAMMRGGQRSRQGKEDPDGAIPHLVR